MSLSASLSIATSGLNVTQYALSVASQNVANAGTSGYVAETANVRSRDTNGVGSGVSAGPTTLAGNEALQNAVWTQNATTSALSAQNSALSAITSLQGSTSADSGSSGTLSDQLGNVQSALVSLTSMPGNSAAQTTVVANAGNLATTIHNLASGYQTQRQNAQDAVVSSVSSINTNLTTIGALSTQIMKLQVQGLSTADLENQRNTAVSDLSGQLSIKTQISANGDMMVRTSGGLVLPTHNTADQVSDAWPLQTSEATVTAANAYPGTDSSNSLPGITLGNHDVTSQMQGGTLGGNIALRDSILPKMQAQLDSFSYSLATRFQAQGMDLFAGSGGKIPPSSANRTTPNGIVGFAQDIQVNSTISANPAQLVGNAKADTTIVRNVLNNGFGATDPANQSNNGLGINGNLSISYDGSQGLVALATSLTSDQANIANSVSSNLSVAQTTQTSLGSKLSSATGVSVDNEMSNIVALQNAYTANAKVVSAVRSMFQALLDAV
ncbi:flagellar hook-associated protein FlgK [Kozakia baliensis]|uniref:Flagellar hook-associated protein 1 n=1 Tax=Kozakia baliensis TaxID=153496 RepID=A0A1D8UWD7_9PROT|nr:flagellar hook-associated protein FlgK [Kozakia baliensis]AOX17916.1 flagellar hook-associated protein FlgK [Kozakia baliensis]GBR26400.1 flagellar hook-associated protein FlgK [Kozakia baliensis NRIC 0488]GEL64369.1 flagellar hook-associated protein 1 [Kozakia baliensis]